MGMSYVRLSGCKKRTKGLHCRVESIIVEKYRLDLAVFCSIDAHSFFSLAGATLTLAPGCTTCRAFPSALKISKKKTKMF